tara:strand:+ start:850 stop:1326 length:477 start_codon:yes stop_codon:yes gene_type:complete
LIVLDLETTGFKPRRDRIIEVAAIKLRSSKPPQTFHCLCNPGVALPKRIKALTSLNDGDFIDTPFFSEIAKELFQFMKGHRIIGYNVAFDKRFLVANSAIFTCLVYYDYLKYLRKLDYEFQNYRLETVAGFFGIKNLKSHRAINDAQTVVKLIKRLGC